MKKLSESLQEVASEAKRQLDLMQSALVCVDVDYEVRGEISTCTLEFVRKILREIGA